MIKKRPEKTTIGAIHDLVFLPYSRSGRAYREHGLIYLRYFEKRTSGALRVKKDVRNS